MNRSAPQGIKYLADLLNRCFEAFALNVPWVPTFPAGMRIFALRAHILGVVYCCLSAPMYTRGGVQDGGSCAALYTDLALEFLDMIVRQ